MTDVFVYPAGEPPITVRAAHDSGQPNTPVTRIVHHDEEFPVRDGSALEVANFFAEESTQGSAHYCEGPDDEAHCVPDDTIAWHAPPNQGSIGIEQNGYATFATADWESPDSLLTLRRTAARTAELCARFGVPIQWLSVADLLAGKGGITSHANVSGAWHQSDHSDPGPNYPVDLVIGFVLQASGLPPTNTGGTDEMISTKCSKTGEIRLVDAAGEVFTFLPNGTVGGLYLGGLNVHPLWNAGDGHAAGPVVGAENWPEGAGAGPDGISRDGLVIITRDTASVFHSYAFPGDGSLSKPGKFGVGAVTDITPDPATIHIYQGATYRGTFTWKDPTGVPISLAGLTGRFRILSRAGGTVQLEVVSTDPLEADGTVNLEPDGNTGQIGVRLTAEQTALLTRAGVYSLDVLDPTDDTEVDNVVSGPTDVTLQGGG